MHKFITLSLIILLSWWSVKPIFNRGFFPIHDSTQVARVHQMAKALREGQFPVRWVPDLGYGYGYPLFNFYAPFPYYVGVAFMLLGFDALVSTKIMFLLGIILSGITMFAFSRLVFNNVWVGFLAAILYLYAPYHALDIYVRGAVGEFWAMGMLPLVAIGIHKVLAASSSGPLSDGLQKSKFKPACRRGRVQNLKLQLKVKKETWNGIILGGLGLSGVILSHNITGMLTLMVLGLFFLIYISYLILSKKTLLTSYFLLLTTILGLGLSAFFWLPAVVELPFTSVNKLITGGSDFRNHFVYLDQLWASPWGYAGSAPGRLDGMSFMAGKIHIILAMLVIILSFISHRLKSKNKKILLFFLSITLFFVFMTTQSSQPLWEAISLLHFVQFPWRMLVFITFFLSILASAIILFIPSFTQLLIFPLLTVLIIGYNVKYFQPQRFVMKNASQYTTRQALQWDTSRIFNEYMPSNFSRPLKVDQIRGDRNIEQNNIEIIRRNRLTNSLSLVVKSEQDQQIILTLADFPGWEVKIDGKRVPHKNVNGRIAVLVDKGTTEIKATFTDTPVRKIANLLSLFSFIVLGGIYAKKKASS